MGFQIEDGELKKYTEEDGVTEVVIPDGVTSIGDWAFSYCESLSSITIPDSVESIGDSAFCGCYSLTGIIITDSVTSIGENAFFDCGSLTSITVPNGVTHIGDGAFDETQWRNDQKEPFVILGNGILYDYIGEDSIVNIPDNVTSIGEGVFFDCTNLTSITLPDSVTSIGEEAFRDCTSLTSISIPQGVTNIGGSAFESCTCLTEITLPVSVTSIGEEAFRDCTSLTRITIPDSVTSIGDGAFCGCSSLTGIIIPNSVTSIGDSAFCGCSNLTDITIPDNVTSIGNNAFTRCGRLTSIIIPNSVTSIGESAFYNCESLSSITIPDSVINIGKDVFSCCKRLSNITIPGSVIQRMTDGTIKNVLLSANIWGLLSEKEQLNLFMTRHSKTLLSGYTAVMTQNQLDAIAQSMLTMFENAPTAKECDAVATLLISFSKMINDNLGKQLFAALQSAKNGKKAFETISKDASLLKKYSGKSVKLSETERIAVELIEKNGLSINQVTKQCAEFYSSCFLPDLMGTDGKKLPDYIMEYILISCVKTDNNQWRDVIVSKYTEPGIPSDIKPLLEKISPDSLQEALKELAKLHLGISGKSKKMYLAYPICRYGSDELMEELTKIAPKWRSSVSGNDAPPLRTFRKAIMYNNSRAAMLFAEKYHELQEYAEIRGTTADALRDQFVADVDLDENGTKVYDLGNQTVTVQMLSDFTFRITTQEGKVVKSIPKKGADETKYAAATKSFSEIKKAVKGLVDARKKVLFESFLNGKSRKADEWVAAYQNKMMLRQVARLIVWRQGKSTFTLNENGAVRSDGAEYKIGKSPITVAHPMDMTREEILAWQKYFTDNQLKQPFAQIWEPVADVTSIKPDRYEGIEIPFNFFRGSEKHGITIEDYDFHNDICVNMSDCSYECDFTVWYRHELPEKVVIKNFKIEKLTRKNNHIISLLDRWTVPQRIAKDDTSAVQLVANATLEQLTYYISVANDNNAVNCMAALLELKNKNYADFDPMDAYTLD